MSATVTAGDVAPRPRQVHVVYVHSLLPLSSYFEPL